MAQISLTAGDWNLETANETECGSSSTNATSSSQLKCVIDDDYKALQRCFLMKGKGRRPTLPKFSVVTNRLLLQLYYIKEDKQTSFAELKSWLETLFPHTSYVEESRIYYQVMTVLNTCPTLDKDKMLNECVDFDSLHPTLTALGLTRLHLTDVQLYSTAPAQHISNDVVVRLEHFRAKQKKTHTFVSKWLRKLSTVCDDFNDSQLKNKVAGIMKTYTRLSKDRKIEEQNQFLKLSFLEVNTVISISSQSCSKCLEKDMLIANLNNQLRDSENLMTKIKSTNEILSSEAEKNNMIIFELQDEKSLLMGNIQELKAKIKHIEGFVEKLKKKVGEENFLFQLDRVKSSSLYKDNLKKKRMLEDIKDENKVLLKDFKVKNEDCCQLKEEIGSLKKKIKSEQSMKSKFQGSYQKQKAINSELSQMLMMEEKESKLQIRESGSSHRFSDNIRHTFYALQGEANVSISNCSKVVSTVARCLFKSDLTEEDLPTQSTSLNLANEAHIIAKEHIVNEIKKADNFTYACDGTSRDKIHYLEKHLHLSTGVTLSLGYSEIASDDSDTLLERCVTCFKDLCELYCIDNHENECDLMKEIIAKTKCLLTDRASVCKAFDAKMAQYKEELLGGEDASTLFLFCNAHFLLALSTAAEDALVGIEEVIGENLGRDANPKFAGWKKKGETAAVRLIRLVASIIGPRCDEKSGCRQEWLAFCSSQGKKSTFTSYRSNRFNNLFQNATALIRHKNDIELFLNNYVSHSNLKFQSIIADLEDDKIIIHIAVLSFLHVLFTEPYWQLMNSDKKYGDFHFYVKKMKEVLATWASADVDIITSTSVFDDFKTNDADSVVIIDFVNSNSFDYTTFNTCLKSIVKKFLCALDRQLNDFLDGGVFGGELDTKVITILQSCPLTNLTGERLFGDLDYCINKRRNASLHLRSTNNMWKHNRTAKWLGKQRPTMAKKLIQKAIKYGPEWKIRHNNEIKEVKRKIRAKIKSNKEQKDVKENKVKQRKLSAINAMLDLGGQIASSKEDLDMIYSGPRAVQRLKDQIRYRNLVMGEKIVLKGNKQMLYDRLLHHITN